MNRKVAAALIALCICLCILLFFRRPSDIGYWQPWRVRMPSVRRWIKTSTAPLRTKRWNETSTAPPRTSPPGPLACPRILLIIVFNEIYYKNIPYLKQIYGKAFQDNIVYYGPAANSTYNVTLCPGHHHGYLQQRCIAMAMRSYPQFHGYVWAGDDAVVNVPRLLLSHDLDKVWTMRLDFGWPEKTKVKIFEPIPSKPHWYWHDQGIGMVQVHKAYKILPDKYKKRMASALGAPDTVSTAWSDAGYIPSKYKETFLELAHIMENVTFECSIPTMLRLMVKDITTELVEFPGMYLAQFEKVWPPDTPVLHPVKFSNPKNRETISGWLSKALTLYTSSKGDTPRTRVPCTARLTAGL